GIRSGHAMVPRVFISALPADYQTISEVDVRKRAFFTTVLPLILRANEEILAERERLIRIHGLLLVGLDPSPRDQVWLTFLGKKYRTYPYDFEELLRRVDAVSPALALAQAAEETGWGQSRFVQGGNALFGQRTWNRGAGIVPTQRAPGATFEVLAFDQLIDSARAYALNLNRHSAYTEFRALRAAIRANGGKLDPYALAGTLDAYSERGDAYIRNIRRILRSNNLEQFEAARLAPVPAVTQVAESPPL
ncbi:MAG: glucosaminidase domain-containing protein, partial [Alphaproteobacteria bacterium]